MDQQTADWNLAGDARSVSCARRLIAQTLIDLPNEVLDVVLLLSSELVTNAVNHGIGPVGVHVAYGDGAVRVEVEDKSAEWPVVRAVDGDALNGRGMMLVDSLSTGWGVIPGKAGKTVWFTAGA